MNERKEIISQNGPEYVEQHGSAPSFRRRINSAYIEQNLARTSLCIVHRVFVVNW